MDEIEARIAVAYHWDTLDKLFSSLGAGGQACYGTVRRSALQRLSE
jgi:hypothetical protein